MSSEAMVTAENSLERRYTVAVTGGCGFLGQHLIRLLQTQSDHIETIRVLDFFSFQRELDYVPVIRTESILGTVTSMEDVMTATKDVLTVFHLASVTDHQLFPDHHISRMVNVKGTKILIEACEKNDVSNLIYVSDISVVMGYDDIKRGTEERTPHPWVHLFQDGITKCAAEKLVLKANGKKLSDDKGHLKTIILRPVNIYGELDSYLLPHFLELAVLNEGSVLRMGTLRNRAHLLYAGNAAWALICAHVALSKEFLIHKMSSSSEPLPTTLGSQDEVTSSMMDTSKKPKKPPNDEKSATYLPNLLAPELQSYEVDGKVFFLCDDTPPCNLFLFFKRMLFRYGFFMTSSVMPEKWAKLLAKIVYFVLWLLYPIFQFNPVGISTSDVHMLCHTYTFSDDLAREQLHYTPIFSFKECYRRTVMFYDTKYKEAICRYFIHDALNSKHVAMLARVHTIRRKLAALDLGDRGKEFQAKVQADRYNRLLADLRSFVDSEPTDWNE